MIICGIRWSVPYFVSISCTILGITTAGDTALKTAPITAASTLEICRIDGAKITKARISKLAGTQDIISAGLPTFFRSARFRDNPAFSNMMISAICRNSEEIPRTESESQFNTQGPNKIPVSSIPMIRGILILWHNAAMASPSKNTNASEVNMFSFLLFMV